MPTITDKVDVNISTTGTSTSTTWRCPYTQPKAEQGWECPRCGHINAPWVRQCDCSRSNWTITCNDWTYKPEWWKEITCHDDNIMDNPTTYQVGGSDYKVDGTYINVSGTQSNNVNPNSVTTAWNCTNPDNCHTPHYTTETVVNDGIHNFYNLRTPKETK